MKDKLTNLEGLMESAEMPGTAGGSFAGDSEKKDPKYSGREYVLLQAKIGEEKAQEVLEGYYTDVKKAKEMLEINANPLNQALRIPHGTKKKDYPLHYSIIEKGESTKEGLNLRELKNYFSEQKDGFAPGQKAFIGEAKYAVELSEAATDVFAYLSHEAGVNFKFSPKNIKLFLNETDRRVEIVITSLGGNLEHYYDKSPKSRAASASTENSAQPKEKSK
jgi:hypothetical protein